ncbi:SH3 domain-containing protein [Thiorhodococcus minor]|uniref:SH3 domain-containing protein n=1 Tax=Thiorhodococcus minor TaxID=57489 RepID=A0A6M0K355_9GAMM|nr:SH3 domain-containing protein [Thiorhodococcus minor]NEV63809.1 SH3 domain-containing protein [Thiorhodococcus minor]
MRPRDIDHWPLPRKRHPQPALGLALLLQMIPCSVLLAGADGPDFFSVTGVAANNVLNLRAGPSAQEEKIGEIPPDGTCLRNLGCRGGLTYQEYSTLSTKERAERLRERPRWCQVDYQGLRGWVAARYLVEGSCAARP